MAADRRWKVKPAKILDDEDDVPILSDEDYAKIDGWTKAFWEGWAAKAKADGVDPSEATVPGLMPCSFVFMAVDCFAEFELFRLAEKPLLAEVDDFTPEERVTLIEAIRISLRSPFSVRSIEILNSAVTCFPGLTDPQSIIIFEQLRCLAMGLACKGVFSGTGEKAWHPDYASER